MSTKGLSKDLINKDSILNGAKYFSLDGLHNYLVFTPVGRCISTFSRTIKIYSWKSKGMSEKEIHLHQTIFLLQCGSLVIHY